MKLRKLEQKDAMDMLEWMKSESVTKDLRENFAAKTIEDCVEFIEASQEFSHNIHLAIVDEHDIYMGTVSLKGITKYEAEFAIVIRTVAMQKGYSKYAMEEILKIAFEELRLRRVYWYVAPSNLRALSFYDKNGYERVAANEVNKYKQIISKGQNYLLYEVIK